MRQCGDCTLCCKLVPVRSLGKGANERCKFQRHTGCMVYHKPGMPPECMLWNCRWLVDNAGKTSRPDRVHYVIDIMPDFVEGVDNETGERFNVEVIQIWVDPKYPDAWRDPDLLSYLEQQGRKHIAALIRLNAKDGFVLSPPTMSPDGEFLELRSQSCSLGRDHDFGEVIAALGGEVKFITTED